MKKWMIISVAGVCLALLSSGVVYITTRNYYKNLLSQVHPLFVPHSPYNLLHPIVGLVLPSDQLSGAYADINSDAQAILASQSADTLSRYAFYFRDLNS